jgi:exopolysaccharide biosynthesis polyprenyl glycosylphosphotransferase
MNAERQLIYRLLLADVVALCGAFLFTYWAVPIIARTVFDIGVSKLAPLGEYLWLLVVIVPAWVMVLNLNGDYPALLDASTFGVAWHVLRTGVTSTALVALYLYATKNPLSRIFISSDAFFSTCLLMAEKTAGLRFIRSRRRVGWDRRDVLVLGDDDYAAWAIGAIREDSQQRMEVWGCLSQNAGQSSIADVPIRGTLDDYRQIIWKSPVEEVLISPEVANGCEGAGIIRYCELIGVTARIIPNYGISDPHLWSRMKLDGFLDRAALTISPVLPTSGQLVIKRGIDLVGSMLLLVLLSPLFALFAVAVKLSSPGPVFYRWRVVGKGIRPFTGYKFRTMVVDADALKASLATLNEMSGPVFKIKNDPRITPLGRLLRKYSLDELPQLWSVFTGEMSLVGPRPPGAHEFERFEVWHRRKLSVKPGITCLWQVMGRNRIADFDDWVTLDLQYIDNWSLWLDLKIIAKTATTVIKGTGV